MSKKILFTLIIMLFAFAFYSNAESINYTNKDNKILIVPIVMQPYHTQLYKFNTYDNTINVIEDQLKLIILF